MNYKKGFLDALFTHIDTFYSTTARGVVDDFQEMMDLDDFYMNLRMTKLPILNLSWKKTQNSDMNPKTDGVNIQGIYYLLM